MQGGPPPSRYLHVVAAHRKPERHRLGSATRVHRHQSVSGPDVAREEQEPARQISLPIVEKEVRALADVFVLLPDAQKPPDQADQRSAGVIVEEIQRSGRRSDTRPAPKSGRK